MVDIFSQDKRSEGMSKIRGKDTKIEQKVRKFLFAQGLRFRKNDERYPGTPDVILPKYKRQYLFMDVFGMGMRVVNTIGFLRRGRIFGKVK